MGLHQKQAELWVEPVNLGRRVPEDHLLRKLNKMLDLSFVREEVAKFYGRNGNVSVDPVVIMKMMLLLFLDNVKSERELVKVIPMRIDYLWYLGWKTRCPIIACSPKLGRGGAGKSLSDSLSSA